MQFRFFLAASVASLSLACAIATPAMAQETTSAVRGSVEGESGPIAGAEVVIVHEPSGTTTTTRTGSDGGFSASGLRAGGPFVVTVEAPGFEGARVTDLFLQAGQPFRLPIVLQAQTEIVVSASKLQGALATSMGPISSLRREDIEGVASVNRDIRDVARRDAFVTIDASNSRTIEVAGQNGRLNRFSVDGIQLSDDFGINNGGLPTSRGPVPFDAIEQLSVKVAPYDISEGDFQGGAVNVVLRSGGNRFTGSAFFTYSDDGLTGKNIAGSPVKLDFTSKQYGAFLSGPIVKDRLFFALAYERTKESDPIDEGPADAGFASPVPRVTSALVDQISQIAKTVYGYDTLGTFSSAQEQDEKIVAKVDWNATDDHRLSLTYIRNVGSQQISSNMSTVPTGPTLGLRSDGYELTEEINSGSAQILSDWSDSFSTELRVSYRDYNRGQTPFGSPFAQFGVCTDPVSITSGDGGNSFTSCGNTSSSSPRIFFGPDISRQANKLNTDNLSVDLTAKWQVGAHSIKGLVGYGRTNTFNLFLQRASGEIYFDSIADFQNRLASQVRFASAVPSLDANNAAANFSTSNLTFGLQDDWQISDSLQVTLAARYDYTNAGTPVSPNQNFTNRTGFPNTLTFDGLGVFQPRMGFEWKTNDRLIIRGGVGRFAGGAPDVFLSNSYSATGQLTNEINIQRTGAASCNSGDAAFCTTALTGITGNGFPSAVNSFLTTNLAGLAAAPVAAISPDYRLPSQWRATLSASYDADLGPLGDNWLLGADLLYGWTSAANTYVDLRSVPIGTLPDGRIRYGRTTTGILAGDTNQTNQDLVLSSTGEGKSFVAVGRFEKKWDFGLGIGASYTYSRIRDVNPITSATPGSLYANAAMGLDPNYAEYGRSIYEFTHAVKFNIDFEREFFGDNKTRFAIFGEYRTGRPFSYTMRDTSTSRSIVFGTNGTSSNNLGLSRFLLYVPTGTNDSRVSYDSVASQDALNSLIDSSPLGKYRGSIAPKNIGTSSGYWKVDLHIEQELPGFFGSSKFKLFADIENFLNLLDRDWGVQRQVIFPYFAPVANVQCLSAPVATGTAPGTGVVNTASNQTCAQYRYSSVSNPNVAVQNQNKQSLYQIRIGARFEF